jgi:hypothetical protein
MANSAIFVRISRLASLLALLGGCGASERREVEEVHSGITFEELRFRAYRGPALTASGEADRATFRRDTADVEAQVLRVHLPARPGEPDDLVEARRGRCNLRTGEGHLSGGAAAIVRGGGGR